MKTILFIFLCGILCGCYTNKITVIDSQTLEPVPDALVLTDKQYKIINFIRAYKTNEHGMVYLDYNPTYIFAGKQGYWLGTGKYPNIVFLTPEGMDPSKYTQDKDFPSLYVPHEYLSKDDPLYGEWKAYSDHQQKMRAEFLRDKKPIQNSIK
ncbi:MAG: hypothetical protein IJI37_06235 [Opitutales bacterium]|nr:hypothetical protein [Opitutales bacterium]